MSRRASGAGAILILAFIGGAVLADATHPLRYERESLGCTTDSQCMAECEAAGGKDCHLLFQEEEEEEQPKQTMECEARKTHLRCKVL